MAYGTIGGAERSAADFQILAGVRVLLEFDGLARPVRGTSVRAGGASPVSRLGGADPARPAGAQLSEGSAGIVAISR
jgi:hypothetical protein